MGKTISLDLPERTLERYRHGAAAAGKVLEQFLAERLDEAVPPVAHDLPSPHREELTAFESLDDEGLWEAAKSKLPQDRQRLYDDLLDRNSQGLLTPSETEALRALGEEARLLALKKSHAYMVLKWRGHMIPAREELLSAE